MNLKFRKGLRSLPVLFSLFFFSQQLSAQNCTVNAGVPGTICPGQPMVLKGVFTGLFASSAVWSQVSGPQVTIGTPVVNGSDITANVTGFSPGNAYTFRITARCQDGSQVFQDVTYTTLQATKATVGGNITSCPGLVTLTGNAVGVNETGDWSITSRAYGMVVNTSNSPTSTLTLPTDSTANVTLKWTITNTNGCASAASMTVTNIGANPTVSAGGNQNLSNCYDLYQATGLFASYGGNGTAGQQGTWSFVSGPSIPTFDDIHNNRTAVRQLITGTYRLRWTVAGPCANGSAEMTITVPPPTQSVTGNVNTNIIFCDTRTATAISAPIPSFTNETGVWTITSGPGAISSSTDPAINVTGLSAPTTTSLRYTITNNVTGCVSVSTFNVIYLPQPTITSVNGPIISLPSTATAVTIPYSYVGGNQTVWQLVTAPLGSTLAVSGTTAYQDIDASPITLTGLDKIGTYYFRMARVTNNAGQGGCANAFADVAVVISQPPTAANAGTSGAVACNVFTTTLAGNAPAVGTGYWSQVSGPSTVVFADIYDRATGISNLTNGAYTFRWIVTGGFGAIDAQADVTVSVASTQPTAASAGTAMTVCNQTPVTLSGNTPALNEVGTWSIVPSAGVTFVNTHDPNTKVTGLANNTSYSLTWTIVNSCGSSFSTTTISTTNTAGPKAAIAGAPQCLSSTTTSFTLAGNDPAGTESGSWRLVSGPNSPSITSPTSATTGVNGIVDGIYKFEWKLQTNGCAATLDTVIITASAAATVATVTTTPVNLCNVNAVTLAGNTPTIGTGKWTQVGGPGGAVITDPLSPTSTVTGLIAGSYIFRWTISNGACNGNSADVKYNISAPPTTPTVGAAQELCNVFSTTLSGNTITAGSGLWQVVGGPNTPTFSSFTNPTATISGLTGGTYKFIWTATNGVNCGISQSTELSIVVRQAASASATTTGLCNATVAQLTGNNGSTGTWTFVSGSTTPSINQNSGFTAIATNLVNGSYTFKYTIPGSAGCPTTSSATTTVVVTASPSVANAGIDQVLCSATGVTLAASMPSIGTGTWTFITPPGPGTSVITNTHSPTTTITGMGAGVYLLQWNVTNGFCGTNQDIVRITLNAPPTTASASANSLTAACSGNLVLLGNTPTVGLGSWSQVTALTGTIDAPNSPTSTVNGTQPGTYTFMWTIANGNCAVSTATVSVVVNSTPPNVATVGPPQNICNVSTTASAALTGSTPTGGETGLWTTTTQPGGSMTPTFGTATSNNTTVSNLTAGTYIFTWTVSNGSCTSYSSVTINVTNSPTPAAAGADQSICLYTPVALNATAVSVGVGTWSVTSQPISTPTVVFTDVNSPTTTVNGLTAGDYTFTWITTNGAACATSMSNTTVHIVQPPTAAQAGNFKTVCLGIDAVMSANTPTFGIGTWTISPVGIGTITNANSPTTTVTGLTAGVYQMTWTITNGGCSSVDATQITVQPAIANNTIGTPQTICSGSTPAGLTGTISTGGNGTTYAYQWQSSTTSALAGFTSITGATTATTYTAGTLSTTTWYRRLTTSGACANVASTSVQITVQPPLTLAGILTPATTTFCASGDPGVIVGMTPTGGDGSTYAYVWSKATTVGGAFTTIVGATARDFSPGTLTSTVYYQRTTTSGSCTITSSSVTITINPLPTLISSMVPLTWCSGTSFSYSPNASIVGTSFSWSRPTVTNIATAAPLTGTGVINSHTFQNVDVVPIPVYYYYTLTAPTGCTNPTQFTLTLIVNPVATVTKPTDQVLCAGLSTTAVIFSGSPLSGTTYSWINNNTNIGLVSTGNGDINSFTATNNTNAAITAVITVQSYSNSCAGTFQSFSITVNPKAAVTTMLTTTCSGVPFNIAPVNGTNGIVPAGTTYTWAAPTGAASANGTTGTGSSISGNLSHTSNTAQTAVYMITPNTSACGDGAVFSLTVTVSPVAAITDMTTTVCAGIQFTSVPSQTTNGVVPAGTTYTWTAPTGSSFTGGTARLTASGNVFGTLTNSASTATSAAYRITPTSGSCIGSAFTLTVALNPKARSMSPTTMVTCSGVVFDITPTDGFGGSILPAGTGFVWAAPTGTSVSGAAQAISTTHISGTPTNSSNVASVLTYLVTPVTTQGSCVGDTWTISVTVNPIVNVTTTLFTRTICSGTAFSVTPTNGVNGIIPSTTQYRWSVPTTTGTLIGATGSSNTPSISATLTNPGSSAQTATYVITPSVACGDGASFTVVVTVQPQATITPMSTTICGGSSFSMTPTDVTNGIIPTGTVYRWNAPSVTGLSGGAAQISRTNVFGTLLNTTATVGTAVYTITPTTLGGCTGTAFTVTVTVNPIAQINSMTNVICNGSSFTSTPLNTTNGIVPSGTTYTWLAPTGSGFTGGASGTGSSIVGTLANSSAQAYTATYMVTPTSGSCTGNVFSIVVTVNPIAAVTDMTTTSCSGVMFSITPTNITNGTIPAGTLYSWNTPSAPGITGAGSMTNFSALRGTLANTTTAVASISYTITPTSNGCTGAPFTLTVTINPSAQINALSTTICGGAPFTVTPANVTDGRVPPATNYTWLTPTGAGFTGGLSQPSAQASITGTLLNTINTMTTVTYMVTPITTTNGSNCSGAAFSLTVNLNPLAQVTAITSITCSGVAFSVTPTNLTNGIVPTGITYRWGVPSVTGGLTGGATLSAQTNISGNLINPTNVQQTATYTVIPTTSCGDGASFTVTVTIFPTATITSALSATTCAGVAFTVTPTNGTDGTIPSGTRYSWSGPTGSNFSIINGATGSNAADIKATLNNTTASAATANFTVTTLSGFCAGATFTVTITLNPRAQINAIPFTVCSGVAFAVTPVNGTDGIVPSGTTYQWLTATGSNLTGLASGSAGQPDINATLINNVNVARTATYIVTPTSATGSCTGASFTVTVNVNPRANVTAMTAITCSGVGFSITPTNLTNGIVPAGITYTWGAPALTGSITGDASGTGASITGLLANTSNVAQTATYTVTPSTSCGNGPTFTVTVTVNPVGIINPIATATCSGVTFTVTPANVTNGVVPSNTRYTWLIPSVTGGVTGGASTSTAAASITGTLVNPTNAVQTATYTVTPVTNGCTGAAFALTVTINPVANINAMTASTCNGVMFTAVPAQTVNGIVPAGTSYTWAFVPSAGITGGAGGTGTSITGTLTNTTNTSATATYTVTPLSGSCSGKSFTLTVTVNPAATINAMTSTICSGATFTVTPSVSNGIVPANTLYTWSAPSGSNFTVNSGGTGTSLSSISGSLTNSLNNIAVTATYIVSTSTNSCAGATFTLVVTINPTPVADQIASQTICNGTQTIAVNFTGSVANTTYSWTNNTTSIGLASSGTGNIAAFTGTNATSSPVTALITVTPASNTCTGSTMMFTITVNPAATLTSTLTPTAICSGTSFSYTATSAVTGATFAWSRVTVAGITSGGAGTGVGNINQTLTSSNNTQTNVLYVYTITANGCANPITYTVTIPVSAAAYINDLTVTTCAGVSFTKTPANITDGVVPAGTTYTWTTPAQSGVTGGLSQTTPTGSIAGNLVNLSSSVGTATYTVTPLSGGCTGTSFTVTVTVNPKANVNTLSSTICSGSSFTVTPSDVTDGIVPATTTYSWFAPSATGVTGAISGSGAASVSGTLVNTTSIARTITYTVTPLTGSCTGSAFSVIVTVSAKASVNTITTITASDATFSILPADVTNGVIPAGTTYTWTLPTVTGGLTGGVSGAGTAISGTLHNPTNAVQTATYTVTSTSGNCTGATFTLVVTVSPLASVNALTITTCSGVPFSITPTYPTNGNIPSGTTYTWSAPAGTGFTGGAAGTSQTNIGGNLTNTTTAPVTATYSVTPVSGGYTGATFTVTVTINPSPVLSSTLTPAGLCSGAVFAYTATTATTGSVLSWSRTTTAGITSGGAGTGSGDISQTLFNSTTSPVTVNYVYSITANGCTNPAAGTVAVVVNPIPVLNSTLTPSDVYNGTVFNYTATSLTSGTTFAWYRAPVTAINSNTSGSGVGASISETLTTSMPSNTAVVYAITLTANGCVNAQTFTVNVSPTPGLTSSLTPGAICSGTTFAYTLVSATPGTTFTWTRAAITSINANASGSGSAATITETLTNSSAIPVPVVYSVLLTANGFTSTQNVTVIVNPTPSVIQPNDQIVCNGTLNTAVSFGGSVAGTVYNWTNNTTSIGLASAGSGTIAAFTAVNSGTAPVTALITVTPVSNTCSGTAKTYSITINPTPVLSSALNPTGICTGTAFSYTATSATTGTSFTWSRTIVTGITSGGPATGTGNVTGQTHTNSTTAPLTVQYVYSLTANGCSNIQNVSLAVNPTPVLTSTLTPTAIYGGTLFVYTPTSATPSVVFTWSRGTVTGISNTANTGTGNISETLINTTANPINVTYTYTLSAAGCANSQTVTISIVPANIDAVDDDFRGTPIDGANGGTTATVFTNDVLNTVMVTPSVVNLSLVSDGGITGVTFNSAGQLIIPARTTEGTYSVTYRICASANPTNCDQAIALVTIARGLLVSVTPVCINDVPYVYYKIEPNFIAGAVNPVTITWENGDHSAVTAQPTAYNQPLEGRLLWPGAVVDANGNGLDWPGWYLQNGVWVQGADGFENTRPTAYLRISVNPTQTIMFTYPPATPACNANPVNRPPVAVNDIDNSGICAPVTINVLANDSDPEGGALTVSLPSAVSVNGGGMVVNASGTITYTPAAGFVGTDNFTYKITDPQGLTATATVTVKVNAKPVFPGGIVGQCAVPKNVVNRYSVVAAANATNYIWTLPAGWSGTSFSNTIDVTPGNNAENGTIALVATNGACAAATLTYAVNVIDYAKVTLTATPSTVKADGVSTSEIKITLFDKNGNAIHCSGGIATLCSNYGTFSNVIDNGDGTYVGYLKSSANIVTVCGTVSGIPIQQTITTSFTGPQGGIRGNGPIFETETPLLTFKFTEGVGPFTVIYRPEGATKNDTLRNVVSDVAVPVKSISATQMYRMVSIIGSDNARRDNNFTRDTATILVVAPKIIITLTADNPQFLADNLYSTVLRLKVTNIGAIDLSSVQVRADLKDVFPNPVQFILDSVKQQGVKTLPNNSYDGRQNLDLFSWRFNSAPGARNYNDVASVQVPAMAYGNGSGNGTMIDGTDGNYEVPFMPGINKAGNAENGATNDGPMSTPFFFGALSKLDAGEETDMQLYVRIIPNGYFKPFVMQAVALGTGHTEFGTALANSLSNDNGDKALHPEITHAGDPLPTIINVFPNPVLGVAMTASTPVLQGNGTYNVTLNYLLKNYGNVNLRNVKLFEELTRSIGSPATFSIVSAPVSTGNLIANPSYNGTSDTSLLAPNSLLGVGLDATVTLTININPNQLSALYRLFAIGTGFCSELGNTVTDYSANGTDPDPDGNLIPDERMITPIPINISITPLVAAKIGIQDSPTTTVLEKTYCGNSQVTIIPTLANTGGLDTYRYQWQSSTDNVIFKDIAGATGTTLATTFASNVYVRRVTVSGDQEALSNSVHIIIGGPAKPVITASGSLTLTVGGTITLTSTTATGYLWSTSATTGSIAVSSIGSYAVTVTDVNGCKATSDLVTVLAPPAITIADVQKITSKAPALQSDGTFLVDFTIRSSNLTAQQLDSVKIKDDLKAVFPASVQFQVVGVKTSGKLLANELYNGNSQIDLLADGSVIPAQQKDSVIITVRVTPNGFSGLLKNIAIQTVKSPNYGIVTTTSNDPLFGSGLATREPTQFVIPAVDIFIPSGFSPNRDGVNDVFVITRPFNTTINMEIYNRWGNLVYRDRNYNNDWGGKGNQPNNILGEDLPDGTYYYIVLATDRTTGAVRKFAAYITLKR